MPRHAKGMLQSALQCSHALLLLPSRATRPPQASPARPTRCLGVRDTPRPSPPPPSPSCCPLARALEPPESPNGRAHTRSGSPTPLLSLSPSPSTWSTPTSAPDTTRGANFNLVLPSSRPWTRSAAHFLHLIRPSRPPLELTVRLTGLLALSWTSHIISRATPHFSWPPWPPLPSP